MQRARRWKPAKWKRRQNVVAFYFLLTFHLQIAKSGSVKFRHVFFTKVWHPNKVLQRSTALRPLQFAYTKLPWAVLSRTAAFISMWVRRIQNRANCVSIILCTLINDFVEKQQKHLAWNYLVLLKSNTLIN